MEKKVYTSGDVEELYDKLFDLLNEEGQDVEEVLSENGLGNYSSFYGEVMAGGLPEEQVCTPEFCKSFCEGMQEIIDKLENK